MVALVDHDLCLADQRACDPRLILNLEMGRSMPPVSSMNDGVERLCCFPVGVSLRLLDPDFYGCVRANDV